MFVSEKLPKESDRIFPLLLIPKGSSKSVIAYQIDHTERTWGDDIENLLREHIENCLTNPSSGMIWFQTSIAILGALFFFLSFFSPLIMDSFLDSVHSEKIVEKLGKIDELINSPIEEVREKLDFLISIQDPLFNRGRYLFLHWIASIVLGFIIMFSAIWISDFDKPSFVVVTEPASKRRQTILKKNHRWITITISSFAIGIAASVIGNYIYYYFLK